MSRFCISILAILSVILLILIITQGIEWRMHAWFQNDYAKRGQYGDQFGVVNAIFSGLAFAGLMFTLILQSKDLRAQTSALGLQQDALKLQIQEFKEQKEEMARSATAQELNNDISKATIIIEIEKMEFELGRMASNIVTPGGQDIFMREARGRLEEMKGKVERLTKGI